MVWGWLAGCLVAVSAGAAQEELAVTGDAVAYAKGGVLVYGYLDSDTIVLMASDTATGDEKELFRQDRKFEVEEDYPLPPLEIGLSPDGSRLAFVDGQGLNVVDLSTKKSRLLVKPKDTQEPLPDEVAAEGEEFDYAAFADPRWSPDGKTIAVDVLLYEANQWGLVDGASGGWTPLTVKTEYSDEDMVNGWELDWKSDGKAVVVASADLMNGAGLYATGSAGLAKLEALSPAFEGDETQYTDAVFTGDGGRLAVSFENIEGTVSGVAFVEKGKADLPVVRGTGTISHLLYSEGHNALLFVRQPAGGNESAEPIQIVHCDGTTLEEIGAVTITAVPDDYDTFKVDESTYVPGLFLAGDALGVTVRNPKGEGGHSRVVLLAPGADVAYRSKALPAETIAFGLYR